MTLYETVACQAARQLTESYSTSFSLASRLFGKPVRQHIYNIYGMVRLADEIVDSYRGHDAGKLLDDLEAETYAALERGYSTNLIVQAFVLTGRQYALGRDLIAPFFASMRSDIAPQSFDRQAYEKYIYGSAEVVGLMCLRVFTDGDQAAYAKLTPGAQALGAAFQKVNFLRDLADDSDALGRRYFPELLQSTLNESSKQAIIEDIEKDFAAARPSVGQLPITARPAVEASFRYYQELLGLLRATPAEIIRQRRVRVSDARKLWLLGAVTIKHRLRR